MRERQGICSDGDNCLGDIPIEIDSCNTQECPGRLRVRKWNENVCALCISKSFKKVTFFSSYLYCDTKLAMIIQWFVAKATKFISIWKVSCKNLISFEDLSLIWSYYLHIKTPWIKLYCYNIIFSSPFSTKLLILVQATTSR